MPIQFICPDCAEPFNVGDDLAGRKAEGAAGLLQRAGEQNQMGKIEIEFMRRHIGAFGHETHVAERAGIHDRGKPRRIDAVQLAAFRFVDQIELAREAVAQIEAAAAAMADIEHPPQFRIEQCWIIIIRFPPRDRMARRCAQADRKSDVRERV